MVADLAHKLAGLKDERQVLKKVVRWVEWMVIMWVNRLVGSLVTMLVDQWVDLMVILMDVYLVDSMVAEMVDWLADR